MAVVVGSAPKAQPAWRASPAVRSMRKVALLGSHSASLQHVPWFDPSWELWGHASSVAWYRRPLDRYFEMHPKTRWNMAIKQRGRYVQWLKDNTIPIYMQERYPEVPASVRYPREQILLEYGGARRYFKNTMAWMVALAFTEGVTTLALYGINFSTDSEYRLQRGSAEYWLGRAEERGVTVLLPDECTLLAEPKGLYGYESHDDEGRLVEAYRVNDAEIQLPKPKEPAVIPPEIVAEMEAEELERPEWAKEWMRQQPSPEVIAAAAKGNGGVHA